MCFGFWPWFPSLLRQEPLAPFSGEGCPPVVTYSDRRLYKLLSLDSQLTPCRRQELLSQLELCLFCCQGFFLTQGKERKKKKDEVGQSRALPFAAANRPLPVHFWDESGGTLKVQIKALLPSREAADQAQLGVEPVLRAGGVHGLRPSLCRKGRARGLSRSQTILANACGWMENSWFFCFGNGKQETLPPMKWCPTFLALVGHPEMVIQALFLQRSPSLGSGALVPETEDSTDAHCTTVVVKPFPRLEQEYSLRNEEWRVLIIRWRFSFLLGGTL